MEKVKELSAENTEMKRKIKDLERNQDNTEKNKKRLEVAYESEKVKNKEANELEGQFRSKLLRIKSENNSLNANIVTLQTSLDNKGLFK